MGSVSFTHDKVVLDAKGSVRSSCGKGAAIVEYSDDVVVKKYSTGRRREEVLRGVVPPLWRGYEAFPYLQSALP